MKEKHETPNRKRRADLADVLFVALVILYLCAIVPLSYTAVGDARELSAFSRDESKTVTQLRTDLRSGTFGAHRFYVYGGFFYAICEAVLYPAQVFGPLDDATILIISRLVSVALGAMCLATVYWVARKLFGPAASLLAVVALATTWAFVISSITAKPDVPQVLFLCLATYGCVRLVDAGSDRWWSFAVVCAGLAFAIKLAGIFLLPIICLSGGIGLFRSHPCWTRTELLSIAKKWLVRSALSSLAFPLIFVTATPYILADMTGFLAATRFNTDLVMTGISRGVFIPGTVWLQDISRSTALGFELSVLALCGVIGWVIQPVLHRRASRRWLRQSVAVAWAVIFLAYLYWRLDYHPLHYLVPLLPFLCLLAVAGVSMLWQIGGVYRSTLRMVVVGVVFLMLFTRGMSTLPLWQDRRDFSVDAVPEIQAGRWLAETFPSDVAVNNNVGYNYIPAALRNVHGGTSFDFDVFLVNARTVNEFADVDLAPGYPGGPEQYLDMHAFLTRLGDAINRPPGVLEVKKFGPMSIYLNAARFAAENVCAQPHLGPGDLVLPSNRSNEDAVYVFSASDEERVEEFAAVWGFLADRQEVVGRTGERLAVLFRMENEALPDPDDPTAVLTDDAFPKRPAHLARVTFESGIELLGYTIASTSIRPAEFLPVDLYWHATEPIPDDYTVFVHLLDKDGNMRGVGDRRPLDGLYPTNRWKPGDVIIERYNVRLAECGGSGPYSLEAGLYRPGDGRKLTIVGSTGGHSASLGPSNLTVAGRVPSARLAPSKPLTLPIQGIPVELIGLDLQDEVALPGQKLNLSLYWQANETVTRTSQVQVSIESADGWSHLLWRGGHRRRQRDEWQMDCR